MSSQEPDGESEGPRSQPSGVTGTWTVEGGVVPVWVDNDEPPPLIESNKLDPLPSLLDRLGLRVDPDK